MLVLKSGVFLRRFRCNGRLAGRGMLCQRPSRVVVTVNGPVEVNVDANGVVWEIFGVAADVEISGCTECGGRFHVGNQRRGSW